MKRSSADSAVILPLILQYEGSSAEILTLALPYEADLAAILPFTVLFEAVYHFAPHLAI